MAENYFEPEVVYPRTTSTSFTGPQAVLYCSGVRFRAPKCKTGEAIFEPYVSRAGRVGLRRNKRRAIARSSLGGSHAMPGIAVGRLHIREPIGLLFVAKV